MTKAGWQAILVMTVVAVAFWYFAWPPPDRYDVPLSAEEQEAQRQEFRKAFESKPFNPGPEDGSDLVTLQTPVKNTTFHPGVHLGDPWSQVEAGLKAADITINGTVTSSPVGTHGILFRVRGTLLGQPMKWPVEIVLMQKDGFVTETEATARDLEENEAQALYADWVALADGIMKSAHSILMPPDPRGRLATVWGDNGIILQIDKSEEPFTGRMEVSIRVYVSRNFQKR